ncbi:MAG TPA: phosphatase PAP2 family protein, partial [Spirochaetota bacterium]|nr:phosphatase PAP2 family protein [Spirochaetota bacterium]
NAFPENANQASDDFPYAMSLQREIVFFGTGGILTAGAYYSARRVDAPTTREVEKLNRKNVNRFDRSATYNNSKRAEKLSYAGHYAFPVALSLMYFDDRVRREWSTIPVMYLEGLIICNMGITDLTKNIVQRKRPYLYNTDLSVQERVDKGVDGKSSFFSGHTSFNFYSATFLTKVFWDMNPDSGYRYLVAGSTYAIASFVGYMRYKAGKHYPTDILVGAVVGALIGYTVPSLHHDNNHEMTISPLMDGNSYGLILSFNL